MMNQFSFLPLEVILYVFRKIVSVNSFSLLLYIVKINGNLVCCNILEFITLLSHDAYYVLFCEGSEDGNSFLCVCVSFLKYVTFTNAALK